MLLAGILGFWFGGALVTLVGLTMTIQRSETAAAAIPPTKALISVLCWPMVIVQGIAALQTWQGQQVALRLQEEVDEAQEGEAACECCKPPPQGLCETREDIVQQGLAELRKHSDEHIESCPKCQEIERWYREQEHR